MEQVQHRFSGEQLAEDYRPVVLDEVEIAKRKEDRDARAAC